MTATLVTVADTAAAVHRGHLHPTRVPTLRPRARRSRCLARPVGEYASCLLRCTGGPGRASVRTGDEGRRPGAVGELAGQRCAW